MTIFDSFHLKNSSTVTCGNWKESKDIWRITTSLLCRSNDYLDSLVATLDIQDEVWAGRPPEG